MNTASRSALRSQLRAARRALPPSQQRHASRQLFRRLAQHPLFRRSQHIAFYLANDGEIDPTPLFKHARQLGKICYVPVLRRWPSTKMAFQRLTPDQRWHKNRFGIREPVANARLQAPAWRLDLVMMPLVGFDPQGNRLGMGGGFYDRALAYRQRRRTWVGPRLLGLAHDCQKVAVLPVASWDIPLDAIMTDQEFISLR
ncbi:5-formyltetrahydrofolate cyclo-ligase [Halopseudomonas laoshanensis]|uniref:5-formyltetrahydrofolate cyclo-ligase n=1 Tax=Halopseudomonas laoshanensis TaxID=2268758 RepID=A0A7V7GVL4_9GAMM|nr:5-formyltetrahydrofolate cyclo-ligase [Halopseudomonas laoshanensis]KAA0695375.1 5-formyltetrahydrofolate cyclo-ligase [Halopseudomonas laoshanensis]